MEISYFGWVRAAHFLLYEVARCVTIVSEVVTVNKREKLLEILKKYGIEEIRHSADFNPDEDEPSGTILIAGTKDEMRSALNAIVNLYVNFDHSDSTVPGVYVTAQPVGSDLYESFVENCTEVLNANI